MIEHWERIASFMAIFGILFGVYKYIASREDKYLEAREKAKRDGLLRGKEDGTLATQVNTHGMWLEGHEGRIQKLESEKYLTNAEHALQCRELKNESNLRRSEDRIGYSKLEDLVHDTREMVVEIRGMVITLVKDEK